MANKQFVPAQKKPSIYKKDIKNSPSSQKAMDKSAPRSAKGHVKFLAEWNAMNNFEKNEFMDRTDGWFPGAEWDGENWRKPKKKKPFVSKVKRKGNKDFGDLLRMLEENAKEDGDK